MFDILAIKNRLSNIERMVADILKQRLTFDQKFCKLHTKLQRLEAIMSNMEGNTTLKENEQTEVVSTVFDPVPAIEILFSTVENMARQIDKLAGMIKAQEAQIQHLTALNVSRDTIW